MMTQEQAAENLSGWVKHFSDEYGVDSAQVETALKHRCLELLGLCRKAGLLIFGYEAVKKSIADKKAAVVFEAEDASRREESKLIRSDDEFDCFHCFLKLIYCRLVTTGRVNYSDAGLSSFLLLWFIALVLHTQSAKLQTFFFF